jgi:cytochrome c oxidase subunit 2
MSTRKAILEGRNGMVAGVRSSKPVRVALLVGLGLLVAGCASEAPQDTWQPEGENAQKIHDLQWPVFAIAGLVMVIVFVAVGWCVVRYRDRGQPIPKQTHGRPWPSPRSAR